MRDAKRMRSAEPATRVADDTRRSFQRESPAAVQQLADVLALQVLHGDVQATGALRAEVEHVHDVRTIDARRGLSFERKASAMILLISKRCIDKLHGNVDVECQVAR